MFSSPENPDRQIDRMSGCAGMGMGVGKWIWKWVLRLLLALALIYLSIVIYSLWDGYRWRGEGAKNWKEKSVMKDIQVALGYFKKEYGKLPIEPDESKLLRAEGTLLLSLMGKETATNPRGIKFVDLPIARKGKYGLINRDPEVQSITPDTAFVDAWGERYYVLLESTGDKRIPNPERLPGASGRSTVSAPKFIRASSLIFSSGPDKNPSTWDDNICSWR